MSIIATSILPVSPTATAYLSCPLTVPRYPRAPIPEDGDGCTVNGIVEDRTPVVL